VTKETKIGLLVGLAFIILFAIILSEKSGGTRDSTLPTFAMADANRKVGPATGSDKPLHNAGRLPVDPKLSSIVETLPAGSKSPEAVAATGDKPSSGGDTARPLDAESLDQLLNPPSETGGTSLASNDRGTKESQAVPLGEAVRTALEIGPPPVLPKPEDAAESSKTPAHTELASAEPVSREDPESLAEKPASEVEASPPIKTTHEVQAGESLGKIAARYYGRSTPKRVEALYNANRDVLPDVNKVKTSMKLRIPDLGEHSDQFELVSGFLGRPTESSHAAKKDDSLRIPPPIGGDRTQASQHPGSPEAGRDAAGLAKKTEKSPDEKAAGEKPAAEKLATAKTTKKDNQEPEKAAADGQFEWYEVKPSDTLTKIAGKKLGSSKLYGEIARLNRDRINDKNVLKPGLKIRIPAKVASTSPKGDALSSSGPDTAEP
jgi:nucleoid-associated protein YgaU